MSVAEHCPTLHEAPTLAILNALTSGSRFVAQREPRHRQTQGTDCALTVALIQEAGQSPSLVPEICVLIVRPIILACPATAKRSASTVPFQFVFMVPKGRLQAV
jgi:hypothetical protein